MALDLPAITTNPVFLGVVFILFVLALKRVTKILLNCVWITVAAVIFPIIANKVFGYPVPIDADSIIFFITVGIGAYFVFLFASSVYKILIVAQRETEPVTTFLGNSFRGLRERMKRKSSELEEKKSKKKEKEIKKMEEELQRFEEEKKEQKLKEIEAKSFTSKTTKQLAPKKDPFEDYLIIEEEEKQKVKEEVDAKEQGRKKRKDRVIDKFKEAED